MKKLYFVWGIAVLLLIVSSPASATRQPEGRIAAAKKTERHHKMVARPFIKKVKTSPVVSHKKTPAVKKAPLGGTRVIYIHPKPPWYWNLPALFLIGTGIFLLGLIGGRVWKMGPIPRPAAECCGEEMEEPKENWLQRFFGRFRKTEASQQLA
jgi:hypothetical protein